MPKIVVSMDGVAIREVPLAKERTTVGRRPYNDIVIDNLAVSGEHAVIQLVGGRDIVIEDLNSTNGTRVNGRPVKRQQLEEGDVVQIGKYQLRVQRGVVGTAPPEPPARPVTGSLAAGVLPTMPADLGMLEPAQPLVGRVRVLSGPAAGRELELVKSVTTLGKPGVSVAAITRRPRGFAIAHVDGEQQSFVNGLPVGAEPVMLANGDKLELGGIEMQFFQN